jgi:hypothetical protein
MSSRLSALIVARPLAIRTLAFGATALCVVGTALAQAPVPGERWRQTSSMEMQGMSMPMPPTTMCVPVGRAAEALAGGGPDPDTRCTMSNVKESGNSFSADITCVSKKDGTFTGRVENVQESPSKNRGRMTMNSKEGSMVMNTVSEKIGGQCDAAEVERNMRKLVAQSEAAGKRQMAEIEQQTNQACMESLSSVRSDPANVARHVIAFLGSGDGRPTLCTKQANARQTICSAAQTRAGFGALSRQERATASQTGQGEAVTRPLTYVFKSCGLGASAPQINAVKDKLVASAETEGDWGFFIDFAPKTRVDAIGNTNCTGRGFSSARSPRYARFCAIWGPRKLQSLNR